MKHARSFRARLLLASMLWTLGLMGIASIGAAALVHRYPQHARIVHNAMVSVVAFACMAAGLTQLRSGMSPFNELRDRLSAVRAGRDRRLDGDYPTEVAPLVNELNALLADREDRVTRALAKAGDLAHGLKTPLSILAQEAERADAAGHHGLAGAVAEQVDRMRRQVDYHLAHARAAATRARPGARCRVRDSVDGLTRALERLHAARGILIEARVADDLWIRGDRADLEEMLGNLLDNACTWSRARVLISSSENPAGVSITVEDDGPGIEPALRAAMIQRGVKADESASGSGFGLAIVQDIAALYGGSLTLGDSPLGGLRATLQLPRP